jgi:hypothetical protein
MATPEKRRPDITRKAIKTAKPKRKPTPKKAKKSAISRTNKKGPGRPPHKVEDFNRGKVQAMAGYGTTHKDIALSLGICTDTLVKHYARELEIGAIEANNIVMGSMMTQIRNMMPGSPALIIWWTKCKMGWHEGHMEKESQVAEYEQIRDPGELAKLTARELVTLYRSEIRTTEAS